jgi:glycosyltransferase involved in cell wall biosynthesis
MKPPLHFVVPGPLDQRTGGYVYDQRIIESLRRSDWQVEVHELAGSFPSADGPACAAAGRAIEAMPPAALPIIDGLALPAFAGLTARLPRRWIALVHHPLALETGLTPAEAAGFAALEKTLLGAAAGVIVTSPGTRRDLAACGIEDRRIGVACPGTDPAPLARGSGGPGFVLLCVASLTPRKGHLVLLEALTELDDLDWRLTCVGSAERDAACAATISRAIDRGGLRQRVELAGEHREADLERYYECADLFVLASYHEGYGMALAEALARGLPVISTTAGAIPETVPAAAGVLVPPGDPQALAAALRRVMLEPELYARLRAGARAARAHLPSWDDAARAFAAAIADVAPSASPGGAA